MEIYDSGLSAVNQCHAAALLSWNGMGYCDAVKLASEKSTKELAEVTYADGSINAAIAGISKHFGVELNEKYLSGEEAAPAGYFEDLRNDISSRMSKDEAINAVFDILGEIHDQWVIDNAEKIDRDADKGDKRLFQHGPFELLGFEEAGKDLLFLAPILHAMGVDKAIGIDFGKMPSEPWGSFEMSPEIKQAYAERSERFIQKNGLDASKIMENYPPLHAGNSEKDLYRLQYLKDHMGTVQAQFEDVANQMGGEGM